MAKKIEGVQQPIAKRVKVADLRPLENNPRVAVEEAMGSLEESLIKYGMRDGAPCSLQPIVINTHPKARGVIISGHRRWEVTKAYGFAEIWAIPTEVEPSEVEELAIRLNVPAGDWDWSLLMPYQEKLTGWGFTSLELPSVPASSESTVDNSPPLTLEMPAPTYTPPAPPPSPAPVSAPGVEMPPEGSFQPTEGDPEPDGALSMDERNAMWAGMPDYEVADQSPKSQIIISFATDEDREAFAQITGLKITDKTRSSWFPPKPIVAVEGVVSWDGEEGSDVEEA